MMTTITIVATTVAQEARGCWAIFRTLAEKTTRDHRCVHCRMGCGKAHGDSRIDEKVVGNSVS
jgi:hypothetical protein